MSPTIGPTTLDPPRRWARPALAVLVVVVVAGAALLVQATLADRDGRYPGARSNVPEDGPSRVLPPINSEVDGFEDAGPLRSVGPYSWRPLFGQWESDGSFATTIGDAPSTGAVVLVDPGDRNLIVQADVFRPSAGSGLVFRWRDAANFWAVEVAPGEKGWLLTRTLDGTREVLGQAAAPTQAQNISVRLTISTVTVAVGGAPRMAVENKALGRATAAGLISRQAGTRFDEFAVLPGLPA